MREPQAGVILGRERFGLFRIVTQMDVKPTLTPTTNSQNTCNFIIQPDYSPQVSWVMFFPILHISD